MSEITITMKIRTAAAVRQSLFRDTKDYSYEFVPERVSEIREVISLIDEKLTEIIGQSGEI